MVSGSFRLHLVFHAGFLIRSSYQDFFGFHLGSLGFHLGYKTKRIKHNNRRKQEAVKIGSREAEEQEVEQQKHMTEGKNM